MKTIKTTFKKFTGGKRSGAITVKRLAIGGGSSSFDMGPTFNPPFLYATWNSVFARWNGDLSYWR